MGILKREREREREERERERERERENSETQNFITQGLRFLGSLPILTICPC